MSDCLFCKILTGEIPATFVQCQERCSAFLDIRPVNRGHLLIIPQEHATGLADLDPEAGAAMFQMAQHLAGALRNSGLPCEAVNLYLADGAVAGQEVFHIHLHVVPRFEGDGFGLKFGPDYGRQPDPDEMTETAGYIMNYPG